MIPTFEGVWKYLAEVLIGASAALITFYFTKKKYQDAELMKNKTEAELTSSDIIIKNLDIYQKMLDDIEKRYEEKLKQRDDEIEELRMRVRQLEEECLKSK